MGEKRIVKALDKMSKQKDIFFKNKKHLKQRDNNKDHRKRITNLRSKNISKQVVDTKHH